MKGYKAILLGGVCLGMLAAPPAPGSDVLRRHTRMGRGSDHKSRLRRDRGCLSGRRGTVVASRYVDDDGNCPARGCAHGRAGVTSFYGDTAPSGTPAWAQEATMNPDYGAEPAPAGARRPKLPSPLQKPAAAASEPLAWADPGEAPTGVPGVTSYYGDTAPSATGLGCGSDPESGLQCRTGCSCRRRNRSTRRRCRSPASRSRERPQPIPAKRLRAFPVSHRTTASPRRRPHLRRPPKRP